MSVVIPDGPKTVRKKFISQKKILFFQTCAENIFELRLEFWHAKDRVYVQKMRGIFVKSQRNYAEIRMCGHTKVFVTIFSSVLCAAEADIRYCYCGHPIGLLRAPKAARIISLISCDHIWSPPPQFYSTAWSANYPGSTGSSTVFLRTAIEPSLPSQLIPPFIGYHCHSLECFFDYNLVSTPPEGQNHTNVDVATRFLHHFLSN